MRKQHPVRLWAAAFWLLVWEGASLALASTTGGRMLLLASPVHSLGRLLALAATAEFWQAVAFSSLRVLGGFFLSCVLAVALAALAARLRWVRDLLSPLVAVVKAVPVVSFIIVMITISVLTRLERSTKGRDIEACYLELSDVRRVNEFCDHLGPNVSELRVLPAKSGTPSCVGLELTITDLGDASEFFRSVRELDYVVMAVPVSR